MAYKFQKGLFAADGAISGSSTGRYVGSISSSADLAVTGAMHVGTFIYGNGSKLTNISSDSVDVSDSTANSEFRLVGVAASGDGVDLTCMDTAAQRITMNASTGLLTITGDAEIGDDLSLASDSAVLNFGADDDVNLTHVADTGLLLNSGMAIQYGHADEHIEGDGTDLTIASGGDIALTATAQVQIPASIPLTFDGTAADDKISSDGTNMTVAVGGGKIVLDASAGIDIDSATGDVTFMDGGTAQLALDMDGTAGEVIMQLKVDSDDFVIKQFDGTECLRIEDDGAVDIAGGFGSTGVTVSAAGALSVDGISTLGATTGATVSAAGLLNVNNATEATSTTDGSLQTDGGLSVAKSAVVGDDLDLLSDAAILNFGADKDVNLTHVADTGLLLNSSMQLQFRDSTEYINSDADGYINVRGATGVDLNINGTDVVNVTSAGLNVVGTLTGDTSLTLDAVTITTAEIGVLDGVTAGTATASKAVVLDGSKNIATLGTVGCGAITSTGASSFGSVTTTGNDTLGSAGDDSLTVNSVAAFKNGWELNITASGGAMDLTDAGALIVLCSGSSAQTVTLPGGSLPQDGYSVVIKNANSATRDVTITGSATGNVYDEFTIDGQTSLVLDSPYSAVNLIWDGDIGWCVY